MIMGRIIQMIWKNIAVFPKKKCNKFAKTFFLTLILKGLLEDENAL